MVQIKNILCPVDFFAASRRALEYSVALAQNYNATLHILHVVSPVLPTSYEFSLNTADMIRAFEEQALEKVEDMGKQARSAGIAVVSKVRTGDIDDELKVAIAGCDADIIIMGTHGRRGFERWFLGSVTERLLRHSAVPILTLSDLEDTFRVPPDVEKVIVTTDFSEGTSEAMKYALAIAQEAPAEVTLLHVMRQPPERSESVESLAEVLEDHLASMVPDGVLDWCKVKAEVEVGTPFERILDLAEKNQVDLLVMNIHGKGMIERAMMGATAERVIRAARCPVLAVPSTSEK